MIPTRAAFPNSTFPSDIPVYTAPGGPVNRSMGMTWLPAAITTLGSLLGAGIGARTQSNASRLASADAARAAAANERMQRDILAQQALMEEERRKLEAEQFRVQQENMAMQLAQQQQQWAQTYGLQKAAQDWTMEQEQRRAERAAPYREQVARYLASAGPSIIARS